MKTGLSSNSQVKIIVHLPYLSEMKKIISEQNFTENDLLHWIGSNYREMMCIPFEGHSVNRNRVDYQIEKLLDKYKSYLFQEIQQYLWECLATRIYQFEFIPHDSLLIHCHKGN